MKLSKILLSTISVATVVLLSTCKKEEVNTTGDINGIITETIGDKPIAGAIVSLSPDNQTQTTGADGKYVFNKLTPKEYTVQVNKEGYQPTLRTVTVKPGQTTPANFALEPLHPVLSISQTSLDFGATLSSLPIEIKNAGKGTLTWQVVEDVSWISVNPTNGSTTNQTSTVIVTVNRAGLAQGTYNQVISVTSNGGSETITIQVSVSGPVLSVSPLQLDFTTTETEKTVYVSNTGIGTVTFNTTPSNNWISVSPNSGTVTNQTVPVTIKVNCAGLTPNSYTGTVVFNSNSNSETVNLNLVIQNPSAPTLNCGQPGSVTHASAEIPGNIVNIGTSSVTQHGHCWSTSPMPTTDNSRTYLGNATSANSFSSSLNNLTPNTTYYVRAYATNSVGTGYSSQVSFTTLPPPTLPAVTMGSVSNLGHNSATISATLTNLGDGNVTQRGHCWNTTGSPTTSDSKTNLGSTATVGGFSSNLTGLIPTTTYYVRAYATNSLGTSYSEVLTITTLETPPVVTNGLLAYYTFDGQNANDAVGTYHGTSNSGVSFTTNTPSGSGYAASFDGSTGYVSVPYQVFNSSNKWSYSIWFSTSNLDVGFFSAGSPSFMKFICLDSNNKIRVELNYYITFDNPLPSNFLNNTWHLLTVTSDGTYLKYYIDGNLQDNKSTNSYWPNHANFRIGFFAYNNMGTSQRYYNGHFDNVRIYNRALTQSEIMEIFNAKQ
ncbi:MAG TPA: carboxypeptidase regulatory-like domain-containing protein [Salinivirgaceae bacterium]|nr:carboxypeptidase regulatory-like domain-containing protein [Salinivirgaceae bacterium]